MLPQDDSKVGEIPGSSTTTDSPADRMASRCHRRRIHLAREAGRSFDGSAGYAYSRSRPVTSIPSVLELPERMLREGPPWVPVATYGSVWEAEFAAATLTEAGIPARVVGEHVGLFGAGYQGPALHGARVIVPWHRETDARTLLDDLAAGEVGEDGDEDVDVDGYDDPGEPGE